MKKHIYRVRSCSVVGPYTLRLEFDDATSQTVDLKPILKGRMFGPLRDPFLFNQVKVDPESETIVWPNGADFDPGTLHDWPELAEAFIAMTSTWPETVRTEETTDEVRRVAEPKAEYGGETRTD